MQATTKQKILSIVIVVFICALFLRIFVIEGFVVSGDSMEPTIHSGEFVFINKVAYWWTEPAHGDIVVVIPRIYPNKILKRVIGLPGERLNGTTTSAIVLDPKEYYVMGDNRNVSIDSRELGPIDKWSIKGKVIGALNLISLKYVGF